MSSDLARGNGVLSDRSPMRPDGRSHIISNKDFRRLPRLTDGQWSAKRAPSLLPAIGSLIPDWAPVIRKCDRRLVSYHLWAIRVAVQ